MQLQKKINRLKDKGIPITDKEMVLREKTIEFINQKLENKGIDMKKKLLYIEFIHVAKCI